MKITKSQLKQVIVEELSNTLKEFFDTEPELAFEEGSVVLKTAAGAFAMPVEEFLSMKSPSWDPNVVEIEAKTMGGKSIDIPKEMWTNAATRLKQAQQG